jgi:hypothetical protein
MPILKSPFLRQSSTAKPHEVFRRINVNMMTGSKDQRFARQRLTQKIGAQDALLQLDGAAREDKVGTWQHILFSAPVR